ncbi:hypothetical protein N9Z46_09840, partial [Akkermansiaceae bacterium]|nr:hypothetical protein [Akkermansiaceae bacterium]
MRDGICQAAGSLNHFLLFGSKCRFFSITQSARALDSPRNSIHKLDAADRMFPHRSLSGEHNGISFLINGIRDIGYLGTG